MLFGKEINLQPHYFQVAFFFFRFLSKNHNTFVYLLWGGGKNNKSELNITKYHSGIQNPA